MNTTKVGRDAEKFVASELEQRGYSLVAHNWRVRQCEIDLIMEYQKTIYCIEVKFRTSPHYGDGFEYITPAKLRQMHYAAEVWSALAGWSGQIELLAAAVSQSSEGNLYFDLAPI